MGSLCLARVLSYAKPGYSYESSLMTRFQTVEGQMDGLPMPGTIATILALITFRMQKAGYVPWMYQLNWVSESKCMTWQISYEYMPEEAIRGSLTSSLTVEYAHHYSSGNGESTVGLTLIDSTCI